MNEILREIEEDIRRERLDRLWARFGKAMVAASIAIVAVTIVVVVVQNHRQSVAMEKTATFIKGVDRINIEDYKGAIPVFDELAQESSSSYYGLAMLRKAQAQKGLKDTAGAATTYQELASHEGHFSDLATMLAPQKDKLIEPKKDSPFYYSQREWKGWQLMEQGKKDDAAGQFAALYEDESAPYSMRERLYEVLHQIAPEKLESETKGAAHE